MNHSYHSQENTSRLIIGYSGFLCWESGDFGYFRAELFGAMRQDGAGAPIWVGRFGTSRGGDDPNWRRASGDSPDGLPGRADAVQEGVGNGVGGVVAGEVAFVDLADGGEDEGAHSGQHPVGGEGGGECAFTLAALDQGEERVLEFQVFRFRM